MALKRANGTERFDRRSMLRHYNGLGSSAGGKLGGGGLHKSQPRVVLTGHGAFASVRGRSASLIFCGGLRILPSELALPNAIITLTTDYGLNDHLVGTLKGVILKINPEATIVDITHGVAPFDLLDAALAIGSAYSYFPARTIHVVVIDPGVGTERRPLLVSAENQYFVAPDNGVLSLIYERDAEAERQRWSGERDCDAGGRVWELDHEFPGGRFAGERVDEWRSELAGGNAS